MRLNHIYIVSILLMSACSNASNFALHDIKTLKYIDEYFYVIHFHAIGVEIKMKLTDVENVLNKSRLPSVDKKEYIELFKNSDRNHVFDFNDGGGGEIIWQLVAPELLDSGDVVVYDERNKVVVDYIKKRWVVGGDTGYGYFLPDGREFLMKVIMVE